jgi:hypothetical protein
MGFRSILAISMIFVPAVAHAQAASSVLFVGNSFTYGHGSAVRYYRGETVTDLNTRGIGGVPALFKSFVDQAGLKYDVYLETEAGAGLDYHYNERRDLIGSRPWDKVVMHGQSTLDFDHPGDPTKLILSARQMADFLYERNPNVDIYLMATWSRADQTYLPNGTWWGKPIDAMARDVRSAYDMAAAGTPGVRSVIPVGEAWTLAMQAGVADPNPYDGTDYGKVDLWTYDSYHASTYGYYLEALVIFGSITGIDPRSLGQNECSGFELGMASEVVKALQLIAFEQLAWVESAKLIPLVITRPASTERCVKY